MPPTGSVVLRIEPESVPGDRLARYYASDPSTALYAPLLQVMGGEGKAILRHTHIDSRADREFRGEPYTWVFPHVELGLRLGVVPVFGRVPLEVAGPTTAGERVEVLLKADEFPLK